MTEEITPRYIAVDGRFKPSIIRRCSDQRCDKYHDWVQFTEGSHYDAEQIAKAMNEMEARR